MHLELASPLLDTDRSLPVGGGEIIVVQLLSGAFATSVVARMSAVLVFVGAALVAEAALFLVVEAVEVTFGDRHVGKCDAAFGECHLQLVVVLPFDPRPLASFHAS